MSTPISGLPAASTVNSVDLVPIVQGGVTKKANAGTVVSNLLPVASTSQQGIVQLGTGGNNACQGNDARLSNSRTPTGSAGGDLTGTYPNPELAAFGTAGDYGSSSAIPVLTVDSKGRVASIATSQIIVNADNIISGTLSPTRLANSGVTLGTYGSSTQIPVLTLDAKGRVTSISTEQLVVNASNILTGTLDAARLATSGVTAGVVGNSTQIPVLTLDNKGRVTAAATAQLVVNANNITSGTIDPNRLATSGVVAGTVGSSAQIPVLTVDNKGRVTVASSTPVLPGNNASDLTTGTLDPARLDVSGVVAGTYGSSATVSQITVDDKGRVTSATDVGISGSAGGTVVSVGAESNTLVVSNSPVTYSGALQLELSTTGVPAITAGSSTQSAVITVDTYGRITSLETQSIAALFPTGVAAGTYGSENSVGKFTVDVNGVMTGATEQVISIGASQVLAGLTSAQITGISASQVGAGITSDQIVGLSASQVGSGITSAQVVGLSAEQISSGITSAQVTGLSASQIGAGITSAQVVSLSANQIGAGITSAQVVGLSAFQIGAGITSAQIDGIGSAQISGLAPSAFVNTTNATNITSGLLDLARLPFSGVVSGNYGSATVVPVISVDSYGRITATSTANIAPVTSASALTSGTLDPARLADSGVSAGNFGSSTQIAAISVDQYGRITSATNVVPSVTVSNFSLVRENLTASAISAGSTGNININYDVLTQAVVYYTLSATANWNLNLRGNAGTTFNSTLNIGQSITIVFLNTNGASAFGLTSSGAFTIDGSNGNRTLRWANAVIPPPNSNSVDAWSFVVMKTADNSFNVFGSLSTFA
jgi:hypothetical protein